MGDGTGDSPSATNVERVTASAEFGSWRHLSGRFFGALVPGGPAPADEAWALAQLLQGEQALWRRMSGADRRHAVGVARETIRRLGDDRSGRDVVAAALLHDVGKVEASLGTFARVAITFAGMAVGRTRLQRWVAEPVGTHRRTLRARVGLYLIHDRLGAVLLESAGSEPLTVAWAAEHHLAPLRWTVDAATGAALKAADGD